VVGHAAWRILSAGDPGSAFALRALRDLPAAIGFAAILVACTTGTGRLARLPATRPLAAFGTISYGAYLWHVPLLLFLRAHELLPLHTALALAVALPATVAVASASWFLVERPALRWAHRGSDRGTRAGRSATRTPSRPAAPSRV
jgi:peptidoglycan/LPS O-acetylase OafA/YrhL